MKLDHWLRQSLVHLGNLRLCSSPDPLTCVMWSNITATTSQCSIVYNFTFLRNIYTGVPPILTAFMCLELQLLTKMRNGIHWISWNLVHETWLGRGQADGKGMHHGGKQTCDLEWLIRKLDQRPMQCISASMTTKTKPTRGSMIYFSASLQIAEGSRRLSTHFFSIFNIFLQIIYKYFSKIHVQMYKYKYCFWVPLLSNFN